MKTKLFITGLIFIAATTLANGQQGNRYGGGGKCNGTGKGTAYIDKNNNKICDNSENRQASNLVKNENTPGKCNGTGQDRGNGRVNGPGNGKNFADANKNGVCDNYEARAKK